MKMVLEKILTKSVFLGLSVVAIPSVCQASHIESEADEVNFDMKNGICDLIGNARIVCEKETTFRADRIKIFYKKSKHKSEKSNGKQPKHMESLELIEATGHINFGYKGFVITAKNCVYDMKKVTFTSDVLIKNEELGVIKADAATYDFETGKVEIVAKNKVRMNVGEKTVQKITKKIRNVK